MKKKNNILIKYLKDLNFTQNLKLNQNEIDYLGINLIKEPKILESVLSSGKLEEDTEKLLVEVIMELKKNFNS